MDDLEGLDFSISIDGNTKQDKSATNQSFNTQMAEGWGSETSALTGPSSNQQIKSSGLSSISSDEYNKQSALQGGLDALFSTAKHPVACMFHVGFKAAGIFSFMFLNAFIGEEIITFVVVVLFSAFDFWTVKNVSGRLLVNLRWHSEVDDYGNEKYIYESDCSNQHEQSQALAGDIDAKSRLQRRDINSQDRWVFWSALYAAPIIWTCLLIIQILSLRVFWTVTASVCLSFSFTNASGYYYCQQDQKEKLQDYIQTRGMNVFMGAATKSGYFNDLMNRGMAYGASMLWKRASQGTGGGLANQ